MHECEGDTSGQVEDDTIQHPAVPVFEGHQDWPCEPVAAAADRGVAAAARATVQSINQSYISRSTVETHTRITYAG